MAAAIFLAGLGSGLYWIIFTGNDGWYQTCAIDANGDGVTDFVGLVGRSTTNMDLVVADGTTGDTLWKHDGNFSDDSRLICADPHWLVVDDRDFTLKIWSAKAPKEPVVVPLKDRTKRYGTAPGCIVVTTANDERRSVNFATGVEAPCPTAPLRSPYDPQPAIVTVPSNGTRYSVSGRHKGTHLITVEAQGTHPWKVELRLAARDVEMKQGWVETPELLVVLGQDLQNKERGLLVGLDKKNGAVRYTTPTQSPTCTHIYWTNKYIVQSFSSGALKAYDPATGERVWQRYRRANSRPL